jgi:hypothetical protein
MPLTLPPDLLFRPTGSIEPLPTDAVHELMALARRSSGYGSRKDTLETFKQHFATRSGSSYAPSSDAKWADSDLDRYALLASKDAAEFIAAFFDACEKLAQYRDAIVPDESDINEILAKHSVGFLVEDGCLVQVKAAPVLEAGLEEAVSKALADAEALLLSGGDSSGLDLVHPALHGYLRGLCHSVDHKPPSSAVTSRLLKDLRTHHPAFQSEGPRAEDVVKIHASLAKVIDVVSPARSKASADHDDAPLDETEALLVLHTASAVFRYLQETLRRYLESS